MLSYATSMPNTRSAKKAVRSSLRKRQFNNYWKNKIKESAKTLRNNIENKKVDADILSKEFIVLQKVLDKSAKNHVVHKNKAKRLKARYAKKIAALTKGKNTPQEKPSQKEANTSSRRKPKS